MKKILSILIFLMFLVSPILAQWSMLNEIPWKLLLKNKPAQDIKVWKIPDHIVENLKYMLEDFNRRWEKKIDGFKIELKIYYPQFKDMPDDVILDLSQGVFIRRDDLIRLQEKKR